MYMLNKILVYKKYVYFLKNKKINKSFLLEFSLKINKLRKLILSKLNFACCTYFQKATTSLHSTDVNCIFSPLELEINILSINHVQFQWIQNWAKEMFLYLYSLFYETVICNLIHLWEKAKKKNVHCDISQERSYLIN